EPRPGSPEADCAHLRRDRHQRPDDAGACDHPSQPDAEGQGRGERQMAWPQARAADSCWGPSMTPSPAIAGARRSRFSAYINARQAYGAWDAAEFASQLGLPLRAHCTIHWGTVGADDPDGRLFARVREGLSKALQRRGILFAGVM